MPVQGNASPDYDNRCFASFEQAEAIVYQFEQDLASLGISVANGSDLEIICLNIMDLEAKRQGRSNIDLQNDCRPLWRRTVGLVNLLRLLKCARDMGKLNLFKPHLRLLNQGAVSQNVRVLSDDACNKIFEMLVALFCLPLAETLELDDPSESQGKNPDVLAKIDGTIWGFACKTLNGTAAKTMFERMKEGVGQIESSPAQRGAVYFNFRNVIDHERTWPAILQKSSSNEQSRFTFRIWPNSKPVEAYLRALADEKNAEMLSEIGPEHVQKLFVGKKSLPGAMVFLQTAAAVQSSDRPFVATIGIPAIMEFGSVSSDEMQVLQRIQCARRDAYVL